LEQTNQYEALREGKRIENWREENLPELERGLKKHTVQVEAGYSTRDTESFEGTVRRHEMVIVLDFKKFSFCCLVLF